MEAPGIEFSKQLRHYPRDLAVLADKPAKLFGNDESGAGSWGPWGSAWCGGGGAVWGRYAAGARSPYVASSARLSNVRIDHRGFALVSR